MFKKLRDFNEKNSTIFFFIALLVIISFLIVNGFKSKNVKDDDKKCNVLFNTKSTMNYFYDVKIDKNGEIVLLNIKNYGNKYLIRKTENGKETSYFTNYINKYILVDDEYVLYNGNYIVSGIDDRFLFLGYINDLSLKSEATNKNGEYCYINNDTSLCAVNNKTLVLKNEKFTITYDIDVDTIVNDFDVSIKLVEETKKDEVKKDNVVNENKKSDLT